MDWLAFFYNQSVRGSCICYAVDKIIGYFIKFVPLIKKLAVWFINLLLVY
jgi:hypothetical protein